MGLNKSLSIILNLYKKGKINEEDTIHLIDDLYYKNNMYWYPWYTSTPGVEPGKTDCPWYVSPTTTEPYKTTYTTTSQ